MRMIRSGPDLTLGRPSSMRAAETGKNNELIIMIIMISKLIIIVMIIVVIMILSLRSIRLESTTKSVGISPVCDHPKYCPNP